MQISEEGIKKYQTLYKEHFGKEISREEAIKQGTALVRFVYLIGTNLHLSDKLLKKD